MQCAARPATAPGVPGRMDGHLRELEWDGHWAAVLSTPELLPAAELSKNPAHALPRVSNSSAEIREEGRGCQSPRCHPSSCRTRTDVLQHGSSSGA